MASVEERFWAKVEQQPDGCWLWTAATRGGYGHFRIGQAHHDAHRLSWEWAYGTIPPGLCVLHSCDVRRCVNPEHLFLGTRTDNSADMVAKGRARGKAKLTADQVRAIRRRCAAGERQRAVARAYDVSPSAVYLIVHGKNWKPRTPVRS